MRRQYVCENDTVCRRAGADHRGDAAACEVTASSSSTAHVDRDQLVRIVDRDQLVAQRRAIFRRRAVHDADAAPPPRRARPRRAQPGAAGTAAAAAAAAAAVAAAAAFALQIAAAEEDEASAAAERGQRMAGSLEQRGGLGAKREVVPLRPRLRERRRA